MESKLRELLLRAKFYVEACAQEEIGYGFFPGGDPTKFTPDEDNSPEELQNWKEACERWNAGEKKGEPSSHVPIDLGNGIVGHATVSRFGMGSYTYTDEEAANLLKLIQEWEDSQNA